MIETKKSKGVVTGRMDPDLLARAKGMLMSTRCHGSRHPRRALT